MIGLWGEPHVRPVSFAAIVGRSTGPVERMAGRSTGVEQRQWHNN